MKILKYSLFILLCAVNHSKLLAEKNKIAAAPSEQLSEQISAVYKSINFCNADKLAPEVFEKAYRGYLNLKSERKINPEKDILTICDFSLSSTLNRLWIIDLQTRKVLVNTYVAHGQGSGEEFATSFSNRENSHQSSIGFYVTADTYIGEHGLSLHLNGMDKRYNSAAYERAIVVHGAGYVDNKFIRDNNRLGRSWGCPAVAEHLAPAIIETIKDGTCLFIYYPDKKYLASSYWLNKKADFLPAGFRGHSLSLPIASEPEREVTSQPTM